MLPVEEFPPSSDGEKGGQQQKTAESGPYMYDSFEELLTIMDLEEEEGEEMAVENEEDDEDPNEVMEIAQQRAFDKMTLGATQPKRKLRKTNPEQKINRRFFL
jgi:hypothetical protein